jgi:hypothetical protein
MSDDDDVVSNVNAHDTNIFNFRGTSPTRTNKEEQSTELQNKSTFILDYHESSNPKIKQAQRRTHGTLASRFNEWL